LLFQQIPVKKIIAFGLLGLFLFNTGGYFFLFRINQSVIQEEVKSLIRSGLCEDSYILLKIQNPSADPDLKMTAKDEFLYKGHMYDIARQVTRGNTTWFYCVNDRKEESLLARYQHISPMISGFGAHEKAKHSQAILHFISINLAILNSNDHPSVYPSGEVKHFVFSTHLISNFQTPSSPPPEFC
jgi:hypothetical protein